MDLVDQLEAPELGHPQIRQDDIEGLPLELGQGRLAGADRRGLVPLAFEQHHQHVAETLLVIDHEDVPERPFAPGRRTTVRGSMSGRLQRVPNLAG